MNLQKIFSCVSMLLGIKKMELGSLGQGTVLVKAAQGLVLFCHMMLHILRKGNICQKSGNKSRTE